MIDVGVAMGAEGLCEVWPSATICLIDPVEENVSFIFTDQGEVPARDSAVCGGPGRITFQEIVNRMAGAGLIFYDFAGTSYSNDPEVRPLRLVDLVFARVQGEVYRLTAARSSKGDKSQRRIEQREAALKQNPYVQPRYGTEAPLLVSLEGQF